MIRRTLAAASLLLLTACGGTTGQATAVDPDTVANAKACATWQAGANLVLPTSGPADKSGTTKLAFARDQATGNVKNMMKYGDTAGAVLAGDSQDLKVIGDALQVFFYVQDACKAAGYTVTYPPRATRK